jgi:ferredoxin
MNKLLNKLIKPSTRAFFTEKVDDPGYSFFTRIHGYIYGRWPYLYIGVGTGRHAMTSIIKPLFRVLSGSRKKSGKTQTQAKIEFANGYHGKALLLDEARKLVRVEKSIDLGDLEQVIPYTRAREIILKNPDHIAALECPCRASRENPCLPMDVCLIIGEPFAGFILEHHPKRSRRISGEEAADILEQEHKRGHVQHAFFKDAMLNRFYAICNCCSCCCGAIKAHRHGVPMLASSGYTAGIDYENCLGCGECSRSCQFSAIKMIEKRPSIDSRRCMGCGVCVDKCQQGCLSLKLDPGKCPPLEVSRLVEKSGHKLHKEGLSQGRAPAVP